MFRDGRNHLLIGPFCCTCFEAIRDLRSSIVRPQVVGCHQRNPSILGGLSKRNFTVRLDFLGELLQFSKRLRHRQAFGLEIFFIVEVAFDRTADRQAVHFTVQGKRIQCRKFIFNAQLLDNRRQVQHQAFFGIQLGIRAAEYVEDFRRFACGHLTPQLLFAVYFRIDRIQLDG
ncbi:hypothetical protein D3C81_1096830 [compost metagenome]